MLSSRTTLTLMASTAIALGLSACKLDNRPLLARGEPGPAYAAAPGADLAGYPYALGPLDPAEAAPIRPVADVYDGYALAERAYAYDRAAWQAPPDYGFRYGEVEPWAWQTAGDELMFAEPLDDGYRFYYYEPGEAYPYFVRDPRYGYAYGDNGTLAAVFTAAGALLGNDQLYPLANVAGAYLNRGHDLRRTYYAEPRYALVSDPVWYDRWEDRAPVLRTAWEPWMAAADRVEPWRAYRVSSGGRELRAFEPERLRRVREAEKVERKWAKAEDKAWRKDQKEWRKAIRQDDRAARVAYGPPARADGDRHGRDDHRGRGRGHDVDHNVREARPVAVADNRDWRPRGGDDRAGGGKRHDDARAHEGGKGRGGDAGKGGNGKGGNGAGKGEGHGKGGKGD